MTRMNTLDRIALTLIIIGALNWLLVGLFQWDLVAALFGGEGSWLSRLVYTLVGISGLYCLSLLFRGDVTTGNDGNGGNKYNDNNR
ncbi:hypothetical protein EV586_101577 [Tumebacillus sp. BK434]|uniref:DUF378 domain-containing protein n=1 Tax=Tumebacillus sp. BK434 TaxID=2512169 RepID=UPI0010E11F8F|nr:DUF378 domain-containing protein [Tumebacillus sp. BK434]TCP59361.1 hypothetical protein EV586_101577 [Tumebacillus sp. BK434]